MVSTRRWLLPLASLFFAAASAHAQALNLPTLTSVSPNSGVAGTTFDAVITGTNLSVVTEVLFSAGGGITATIYAGRTDTRLPIQISISPFVTTGTRSLIASAPAGLATIPFFTFKASGTWSFTSNLLVDQRNPAVVTLIDGSVLAIGGTASGSCSTVTERYANGAWSFAGFLKAGRCWTTATVLADGRVLVAGGGDDGAATELYDPATSTWTLGPRMRVVRPYHTATLLPNAKVLVAGGTSAEIFDPVSGSWSDAAPMPDARRNHFAILLPNGKVLVTYGSADGLAPTLLTSLLFDYTSNSWSTTGSLPQRRAMDGLLYMDNGKVAITGSRTAVYDVTTGTWTEGGAISVNQVSQGAFVTMADGKLFRSGGHATFPSSTAETYDTQNNSWSSIEPMSQPKTGHFAVLLDNGQILVSGGVFSAQGFATTPALSELYTPPVPASSPSFSSYSPHVVTEGITRGVLLKGDSFAANAIVTFNGVRVLSQYMGARNIMAFIPGSLLTAGYSTIGVTNSGPFGETKTKPYIVAPAIAPETPGWSFTTSPSFFQSSSLTRLLDGSVLAVGSASGSSPCAARAERYLSNGVWTNAGLLPAGICSGTATLLPNGKVLVIGGDGSATRTVGLYDPATSTWTAAPQMNTARLTPSVTLMSNGRVLVAGGRTSGNSSVALADAEIFDPDTLTWTTVLSMPAGISSPAATLLPSGNVMVLTGASQNAFLFDPTTGTWRNTDRQLGGGLSLRIMPDGQVLLSGSGNSAALYNYQVDRWLPTGSMSATRSLAPIITRADGKVIVPGGQGADRQSVELYDPVTGTWSLAERMNVGRALHSGILLDDNKILVVNGIDQESSERYTPATTNPAPALSSISPGFVGSEMTSGIVLTGANFLPNSIVRAGGTRLVAVYLGSNRLLAFIPRSLATPSTSLQITVTNAGPGGGTSAIRGVGTTAGNPVPTISRLSPAGLTRVPTAPTVVTVTGTNFIPSSVVYFNQTALPTTFVNFGTLSATIPASAVTLGESWITVANPAPGGGSTLPSTFIIVGRWTNTSIMQPSRPTSGSTVLTDGRVLFPASTTASLRAAIYDPASNTWTETGPMRLTRSGHSTTLLPNGKVLVAGGIFASDRPAVELAELYNPVTNTWDYTGSLATGRRNHSATLLADGRVLVSGGNTGQSGQTLTSAEIYNPSTGAWSGTGSLNIARYDHVATMMSDRSVIIVGGDQSTAGTPQKAAESYNPSTGTWELLPSMNTPRAQTSAVLLSDGRILVSGGRVTTGPSTGNQASAEIYDPRTRIWSATGSMASARSSHTMVRLATGEILVSDSNAASEFFDPATGTWIATAPRHITGLSLQVLLPDGRALAFSGDKAEIYEHAGSSTSTWSFSVPDRGGASISSHGSTSNVSVGYAAIQPDGNASTPTGVAIFGFRQNGVLITETGVPATRALQAGRVYFERGASVSTGVAIANPSASTATVSFYFTNAAGVDFGAGSFVLAANQSISAFLDQSPFNGPSSGTGTFTFMSSVPVAASANRGTVNERGDFLFTTEPIIDLDAVISTSPLTFPTFADGGGWTTQVVLVNPGNTVLTGTVQFRDAAGNFANVMVDGQLAGSFTYSIPSKSSTTLRTAGLGTSPISGSARAIPSGGTSAPAGLVIFNYTRNGVRVTEAGVPALPLSTAFRMFADSSMAPTWIQSGVTVANPSSNAITVSVEVTRLDGSSTGLTGTLSLPANGQLSRFLNEIPGLETLPAPFQGVVRVSSTTPISAMGLRARYNERQDFLYTTTPPVDENAPPSFSPLYFPQIVDAGGYTTQFILFSGSAGQQSSGTTRIYGSDGQPASWRLQ